MWCTRWFLPLLLLPLPTAPPYFLVLFLFSLTMHAKPCFYCIILLATLFVSSCYWQPFPLDTPLTMPWSENITTFADALNATLTSHLDVPQPTVIRAVDRCWCDFTNGAFFEPFNVSHWEYLSVLRLKDNLERRQKLQDDLPESTDPSNRTQREELPESDDNTTIPSRIWAMLRLMSPGFYKPLSAYMLQWEAESDAGGNPNATEPFSRKLIWNNPSPVVKPTAQTSHLPLLRKEYDLRPYGVGVIVDFKWSR